MFASLAAAVFLSSPSITELGEADALKDGGACEEAVLRYENVVKTYPDGHEAPIARYNQGVCFEELAAPEAALEAYAEVAEMKRADADLRADARFRSALVLTALGRDEQARSALKRLLKSGIEDPARAVVEVQVAWLDAEQGRSHPAAERLARVVPLLEAAHEADERAGLHVPLATASVAMGDLIARRALETPLRGKPDAYRARLDSVGESAGIAESHYVAAMQRKDPTWASAAALHLATLYIAFHGIVASERTRLGAERPLGWTVGETRATAAWLGDRLAPLRHRARMALTLCSDIAARTGTNRFTTECEKALGEPPF